MKKLLFIPLLLLPLISFSQAEKRYRSCIVDSMKALSNGIIDVKDTFNVEAGIKFNDGTFQSTADIKIMNTNYVLEFFRDATRGFWVFCGYLFLSGLILTIPAKVIIVLWIQFFRHLTIRKHGYPPIHCDADGDQIEE